MIDLPGGGIWKEAYFFGITNSYWALVFAALVSQIGNSAKFVFLLPSIITIREKSSATIETVAQKSRIYVALSFALLVCQYFFGLESTHADLYTFGFVFTKITVFSILNSDLYADCTYFEERVSTREV